MYAALSFPLGLILLSTPSFASEFDDSVLDGDTLEVLHNQHPERIRLSGLDCPEKVDQ